MSPCEWHLCVKTCSSIYMLQMVYHTVNVLHDILTVRTCTVWITKLQNGWINMWTEGTVAVSKKAYTGIAGVLVHPLVWKYNRLSCVDADDFQEVMRGPLVGTDTVLVLNSVTRVALVPQLQLWSLNLLLSVQYMSDMHSPVPQLFTLPVSHRRCSSCWNALVSGCCQVPVPVPVPNCYMYRGFSACRRVRHLCISLSFGHNWVLLCTAVCSTHNVTSSTAVHCCL